MAAVRGCPVFKMLPRAHIMYSYSVCVCVCVCVRFELQDYLFIFLHSPVFSLLDFPGRPFLPPEKRDEYIRHMRCKLTYNV